MSCIGKCASVKVQILHIKVKPVCIYFAKADILCNAVRDDLCENGKKIRHV